MSPSSSAISEPNETLRRIVNHIRSVVEEERHLLANSDFEGLDRLIARKDQLAIELSRYTRRIDAKTIDVDTQALLRGAGQVLDSNARLLQNHIEAVSEVAGLICNILVDANSDGTYSGSAARRGSRS